MSVYRLRVSFAYGEQNEYQWSLYQLQIDSLLPKRSEKNIVVLLLFLFLFLFSCQFAADKSNKLCVITNHEQFQNPLLITLVNITCNSAQCAATMSGNHIFHDLLTEKRILKI